MHLLALPAFGVLGPFQQAAHAALHASQGPAAFPQRMEVVFLIGDHRLILLLPLGVDQGQSLAQPRAAVAGQLLQVQQLPELLGPGDAVPLFHQASRHPTQAVLLHDHQTGLVAKEDLIAGALLDPVPAETVQHFQQRGGVDGSRARQAAQSSNTGQTEPVLGLVGQGLGHQRGEETAGDGQADTLGLGDAGELGPGVGIEEHGLLE